MKLASIHCYPVKSTTGHRVHEADVEPWGLAGDRRYLVVDENGRMLTARQIPELLMCVPELSDPPLAPSPAGTRTTPVPASAGTRPSPSSGAQATPTLTLTGPHAPPLRVTPTSHRATYDIRGTQVELLDCGDDAAAWLSALIDRPARLLHMDDPTRRPVNPDHGRPDDRVSLADGYPLLLTSTASLAQLNDWIAETAAERGEELPEPLPMGRFRPSVVVDGADYPFAEDKWRRLRIGAVDFRVSKICDRCVLTTIDTRTYTKGKEPIRTLSLHRRWDGKVWFGINLIPDAPGHLTEGDPVTIL
ncbi:MOSC domain-containing protein [Nonomuraea rhizosphaerae]|uniref:MOSC domain-containing protein n=1 Tax=Nonomuraea rhizosphaerae TaxID=2665663 RepID=UPI001C5D4FCB|nr:MOSC N-terminal beta barrel domain-containing protein [Nonomuraea rhizosphaerae]